MQKQKTRIYMVGPSFKTQGGISSVLAIYHEHYTKQMDMQFITSYSGDLRIKDFLFFGSAVLQVLAICIFENDCIFHLHSSTEGSFLRKSILARICLLFGKKFIFHLHGADFDSFIEEAGKRKKAQILRLLNSAERVVVLSWSWHRYFEQYIEPAKLKVVYNPSGNITEHYTRRNGSKPCILFLGRMGTRKGTYDLITAVHRMKTRNFMLELYGDGEVAKIRELVEKNGISEVVAVNGWIPHGRVDEYYDRADILVLPSYAEGLPMSVLEGMGRGLPVVTTDVGGIPEAVYEGENGFVIKAGDVEALAGKLEILINDVDLRERMGQRSLEIAREKFSPAAVAVELAEIYS